MFLGVNISLDKYRRIQTIGFGTSPSCLHNKFKTNSPQMYDKGNPYILYIMVQYLVSFSMYYFSVKPHLYSFFHACVQNVVLEHYATLSKGMAPNHTIKFLGHSNKRQNCKAIFPNYPRTTKL